MDEDKLNSIILADRSFTLTDGIRGLLETMFENVVIVANVTSLLESAKRLKPDIALVDVSLAGDGNLHWMSNLRGRSPETRLIALSVHDEPGVERAAMKAGCDAVVLKRNIAAELLETVERVMNSSSNQQRPTGSDDGGAGQH